MSFMDMLKDAWEKNDSLLCVGLDPRLDRMPECVINLKYPIFEFNKNIIDTTAEQVCCYKPQFAYYAGQDAEDELKMTISYIKEHYPGIPVILDSKRGDIGSTAEMYAKEAFEIYNADAVTVNPYMGTDTLKPFLDFADRGTVILCRTSNPSSGEIQELKPEGREVYKYVARYASSKWNYNRNVLLVIGATYPDELGDVRQICPDIPFLVPGIGAQGGDLQGVVEKGLSADGKGLIINSSRGIIYSGKGKDYAEAAGTAALELKNAINRFRQ